MPDTYKEHSNELASDGYQEQNESPVPAAQEIPSLPENSFPEIKIPKQVRTGEQFVATVPHDYDLLKAQLDEANRTVEDLRNEADAFQAIAIAEKAKNDELRNHLYKYQSLYGGRWDSIDTNVIAEPSKYDLLKIQLAEYGAEIESLKRERDELKKQLQEPVNTTPRDCIPNAAIECMINTLSGVLLANGIKPMEQRCIYETINWLIGVRK